MNGANLLFVAATVLAATSATIPRLVLARMLTGLAVASNVLGPAIVGDIFPQEHRGAALSLVYLAPLLGGAMGPLISSAVAQAWGWRAVVWMTVGLASGCEVLFLTYFRETYKVAILRRRAARLALLAEGGDDKGGASGDARRKRFKTAFDEAERGEARGEEEGLWAVGKLRDAVLRPGLVLCGSGVLVALTVFSAVVFTYFYIMSTTLSDILQDIYGLTPVATGFCFMSFSKFCPRPWPCNKDAFLVRADRWTGAGSFIGVVICNRTLDRIYIRMTNTHKGVGKPEFRLPLAIIGAFTLPLTVGAYGWVAELRLPLVFLLLSVSCMGTTLMLGMLPVTAYVVDAFGLYSASAMTSVIVTRCLMSTFLPLATPALVDAFGYGWGFMAFTGLGLLLAPIPVLMLRYGAHWRRSSKYTREA
jgi:MFS family permease